MDDFGGILDLLSLNDIELQQRCIQGSSIAEEILTVRYTRLVRACARPYYLAGGDSEDLVQEGMIGLLSAIRNFIPKKDVSFSSYAELCIKRRLFSAIKSANTQKNKPLNEGISLQYLQNENSKENFLFNSESQWRSTEDLVLAKENNAELQKLFNDSLSGFEKKVLEPYLNGSSYNEIAMMLHVNQKSVDNAVQRIRSKVARNYHLSEISNC